MSRYRTQLDFHTHYRNGCVVQTVRKKICGGFGDTYCSLNCTAQYTVYKITLDLNKVCWLL